MTRRLIAVLWVLLGLVAWVLPMQPASALTWSSRSLGHTPFTCSDRSLWVKHYVNAGATIYAVAIDNCGHTSFVTGSPATGYRIEKSAFPTYNGYAGAVDAIARDGSTTWFLRRNPEFTGHLEIWRRSSTGRYSFYRLLSSTAVIAQSGHPDDLVVVGGQWTAAWIQPASTGNPATVVASTLAGHGGHAQLVTPHPPSFGDIDPYLVMRTATDAEVIYRGVDGGDQISLHARHVVQGGFSADRLITKVTGRLAISGRVLQRGSTTYFLFNDYLDVTGAYALAVMSDTGTSARSTVVAKGNYDGQLALDSVTGHLYAVVNVVQAGTYSSLLSNATGTWRSSRLAVGTRDIGFDALTAYSARVAIYYSPASTRQDTVYYQH